MNILKFLKRPSINDGVTAYQNTPGAVLLDVRTPQEYRGGHIPGSVNIPLDRLQSLRYQKDTPLFVYCHSGSRSSQACYWLSRQGYGKVMNIGGIMRYRGPIK